MPVNQYSIDRNGKLTSNPSYEKELVAGEHYFQIKVEHVRFPSSRIAKRSPLIVMQTNSGVDAELSSLVVVRPPNIVSTSEKYTGRVYAHKTWSTSPLVFLNATMDIALYTTTKEDDYFVSSITGAYEDLSRERSSAALHARKKNSERAQKSFLINWSAS